MVSPRIAGFALVELLVSTAVAGLLLAGLVLLLDTALRASTAGTARVEAQQAVRWALDRLSRELREAGFDPRGSGLAAIEIAEPTRVRLVHDHDEDGAIDPTRERVTYSWDASARILRREAGGGAQPLINDVHALTLTYLDAAGRPATAAPAVRSVRVRLEVGARPPHAVMETEVALRNR
jgi:type II secretory pathway component PulJ